VQPLLLVSVGVEVHDVWKKEVRCLVDGTLIFETMKRRWREVTVRVPIERRTAETQRFVCEMQGNNLFVRRYKNSEDVDSSDSSQRKREGDGRTTAGNANRMGGKCLSLEC
jgi:hypothetical protein